MSSYTIDGQYLHGTNSLFLAVLGILNREIHKAPYKDKLSHTRMFLHDLAKSFVDAINMEIDVNNVIMSEPDIGELLEKGASSYLLQKKAYDFSERLIEPVEIFVINDTYVDHWMFERIPDFKGKVIIKTEHNTY